jgi:serum/glucocorticoid-regulated kinase 2
MYELIEKFPVKFPDPEKHKIIMSEEVKDLITKLLEKDPKERLGTNGEVEEIMKHSWFSDLNFDDLLNKKLEAPFIPELSDDQSDVSNFDDQFTKDEPMNSVIPAKNLELIKKRQGDFKDFSK